MPEQPVSRFKWIHYETATYCELRRKIVRCTNYGKKRWNSLPSLSAFWTIMPAKTGFANTRTAGGH
ncbi:hypothetical protein WN48_08846 [Eufriesea mexicana]|uniref:Uncharacterized protein n=1 Tax=Eufriesea mexicana TaxID=516756 RepID=A0A310SET9_9HYME|nr:hypothetical protein WN48_08846 [Eufriesea mexicana]